MSEHEPNQARSGPDGEPMAAEDGVEDIEIDAEDAEAVTGGQTSAFMWVGSRTEGTQR